jgi:hypothetical protein
MSGSPRRTAISLLALTLLLGSTVGFSWLASGGARAFGAPDRVLADSWPLIYGSQAILAAGLSWAFLSLRESRARPVRVSLVALGAWIGELIALTLGGNLLANELVPEVAWVFWWMGTGGPIQPVAAIAGGLAGVHWRSTANRIDTVS